MRTRPSIGTWTSAPNWHSGWRLNFKQPTVTLPSILNGMRFMPWGQEGLCFKTFRTPSSIATGQVKSRSLPSPTPHAAPAIGKKGFDAMASANGFGQRMDFRRVRDTRSHLICAFAVSINVQRPALNAGLIRGPSGIRMFMRLPPANFSWVFGYFLPVLTVSSLRKIGSTCQSNESPSDSNEIAYRRGLAYPVLREARFPRP